MATPSYESVSDDTGSQPISTDKHLTPDQLRGVAFGIHKAATRRGLPVVLCPTPHYPAFEHFTAAKRCFEGAPILFYEEVERAAQLPFPAFLFTPGLFGVVADSYELVTARGLASALGGKPLDRFAQRAVAIAFEVNGKYWWKGCWLAVIRHGRQERVSALREGLTPWLSRCALSGSVERTRRIAACLGAVALAGRDAETTPNLADMLEDLFLEENRRQLQPLIGDDAWRLGRQLAIRGCFGVAPEEVAGELGEILEGFLLQSHANPGNAEEEGSRRERKNEFAAGVEGTGPQCAEAQRRLSSRSSPARAIAQWDDPNGKANAVAVTRGPGGHPIDARSSKFTRLASVRLSGQQVANIFGVGRSTPHGWSSKAGSKKPGPIPDTKPRKWSAETVHSALTSHQERTVFQSTIRGLDPLLADDCWPPDGGGAELKPADAFQDLRVEKGAKPNIDYENKADPANNDALYAALTDYMNNESCTLAQAASRHNLGLKKFQAWAKNYAANLKRDSEGHPRAQALLRDLAQH